MLSQASQQKEVDQKKYILDATRFKYTDKDGKPIEAYQFSQRFQLGEGLTSKVWCGLFKPADGSQFISVALKVSNPDKTSMEIVTEEYAALSAIWNNIDREKSKHNADYLILAECLVKYYGVCIAIQPVLVFECIPKGSLNNWIFPDEGKERTPPFSWSIAYQILRDIIDALFLLHDLKFLHCDVKPDNIFLQEQTANDQVVLRGKLGDFGFSRKAKEKSGRCGSPLFRSPEMLKGALGSYESDMYAAGCTAFEMIAQFDFLTYLIEDESCTDAKLFADIISGKRDNMPLETPLKISHLITGLWHQNKDMRPSSAKAREWLKSGMEEMPEELKAYNPVKYK